jgi:hypothetical protein
MTVHWNARKGFQTGPNSASTAGPSAGEEADELMMAQLLLAMRKVPEVRPAAVNRARKLLADPDYPPPQVIRQVAELLARHISADQQP